MRKSILLKSLVVVGLSILLIANLFTIVKADDDTFSWDAADSMIGNDTTNWVTPSGDNNTANNASNTANNTNTAGNTNTASNSTTNMPTLNTSTNENTNKNSSVNSLAYTGTESNSILAMVIVLGIMVAIYSFKKVREYNSL